MISAARMLRKARALIESGWVKNPRSETAACAVNAICVAAHDAQRFETALGFLKKATGKQTMLDVIQWNDDPATTKADVLAGFDQAIELATRSPQ